MLTSLLVAARIVSNPVSNVFQKQLAQRGVHPVAVIASAHLLLSLLAIPWLLGTAEQPTSRTFWGDLMLCAALAVSSNILLVYALRAADLSLLGPINAYKAVLSLGLGAVVLGEIPTAWGLAGVWLILVGSYRLSDPEPTAGGGSRRHRLWGNRGVQLRVAALVLSATEAVFLKRALQAASPSFTLAAWAVAGLPFVALAGVWWMGTGMRAQIITLRTSLPTCLALAATTGLMQGTTLFTFERLPVGYSLALFQTSALLSVLLGHRLFREGQLARRLTGCLLMVIGAGLIVLRGR